MYSRTINFFIKSGLSSQKTLGVKSQFVLVVQCGQNWSLHRLFCGHYLRSLSSKGLFNFRGFKIVLRSILVTDRISVSVCPLSHVLLGFVSFLTKLFFWYAPYIILWYANVLFGMLLGELYVMLGWSFMLCSAKYYPVMLGRNQFVMLG